MSDVAYTYDALDDVGGAWADIPLPGDWARLGRCRTAPSDIFFPGRGDDVAPARAVCAGCPVLAECREYGLTYAPLVGMCGGLTGRERRKLRHAREVQAREVAGLAPSGPVAVARGTLDALLEQLTAHPGRWARVAHFAATGSAHTTASLLRTGRRAVPPGRWEFEGRRNPEGGSDLYACYLGVDQEVVA